MHRNINALKYAKNSAQPLSQLFSDGSFTRQCPSAILDHKLVKTRDFPDSLFPFHNLAKSQCCRTHLGVQYAKKSDSCFCPRPKILFILILPERSQRWCPS